MQFSSRYYFIYLVPLFFLGPLFSIPNPAIADSKPETATSAGDTGWLGVSIQDLSDGIAEATDLDVEHGILVNDVLEGSPAEKSDLKTGDVITKFNDTDIEGTSHFVDLVRESKPGDKVSLTLLRDGKTKQVDVEIGERKGKESKIELFGEGDHPACEHREARPYSFSFPYPGFGGGYIGVRIEDVNDQLAEALGLKETEGVLVIEAEEDSPAFEAGIRVGDVIVKVDDEKISDTDELRSVIGKKEEGDEVKVTVFRGKRKKTFTVAVSESPGLSSIRKRIEIIDLDDGLEGFEDLRIKVQSEIEEKLADLKEELDALKDEIKELKKEKY